MSAVTNLFVGASHSALYSKFRPSPPPALVNEIISYVKEKVSSNLEKAIDIGCGTGQSSLVLQPYFQKISGFDVSETQINEAIQSASGMTNVTFSVAEAEHLPVSNSSAQLVTSCQAVHWFNLPKFFKEVDRILVPRGALAVYCYLIPTLAHPDSQDKTELIQSVIDEYYSVDLKPFWDEKRFMIDEKYEAIQFPQQLFNDFVRIESIVEKKGVSFADYIGYLKTWSAYQQFKMQDRENADKVLDNVVDRIMKIIGGNGQNPSDIGMIMEVTYVLLMGRKMG